MAVDVPQLENALRRGVSDLALAIGALEAHWEACCGDPDHLPPVQLRSTLDMMQEALRSSGGGPKAPPGGANEDHPTPFVLDRVENPHPRMLAEAIAARQAARDAVADLDRALGGLEPNDLGPDIIAALDARSYWRGYLAAMAGATGCDPADLEAWMDRNDPPDVAVVIR